MINSAQPTPVRMKHHSARTAVAMMRMIGCNNGRYARNFLHSDCVINEKRVVLQKKDNEGFGFVLRGAKGREKDGDPSLSPPSHHNSSSLHALHPRESNRVGHVFHVSYPHFLYPLTYFFWFQSASSRAHLIWCVCVAWVAWIASMSRTSEWTHLLVSACPSLDCDAFKWACQICEV